MTAPLEKSELVSLPDSAILILPVQEHLFTLCENGSLIETPSGNKRLDLNQTIRMAVPIGPGRFLIQSESQTAEVDVSNSGVSLRPLQLPEAIRLVAACPSGLIYSLQDRLWWLSFEDGKRVETGIDAQDFLALREHKDKRIRLLCRTVILTRLPGQTAFEAKNLTVPLEGPAVMTDSHLWATDADHRLRKYRLDDFSLVWEKQMDHQILYPVVEFENLALAVTRSSTMAAIKANGTQVWYVSFGGLPLCPPLILEKRIIVPVRIRDSVHLKIYDHRGGLLAEHPLGVQPQPPFLLDAESLVFSDRDEDRKLKLFRASTLFDVRSSIPPKAEFPKGALLPIELTSINLIKPEHRLSIVDKTGNTVWSAQVDSSGSQIPVWKPEIAGSYILRIESLSHNRPVLTRETSFTVYDQEQLMNAALDQFLKKFFPNPDRQE